MNDIPVKMKKTVFLLLVLGFTALSGVAAQPTKTTVTIAGWGGNDVVATTKLLKEVLKDDLNAANIEVNYFAVESDYPKFILNALSAGNAPDAFYMDASLVDAWSSTGKLAPMGINMRRNIEHIMPVLRDAYTVDDQLYAAAKDVNALVMQFNKDIFDDAGVAYPTADEDWFTLRDKLQNIINTIGDEGVYGLCLLPDFTRFAPFALATGWRPVNDNNRTILDDSFVRAFRFYVSLLKSGIAKMPTDAGQSWTGGCFGTENAAVTIEGAWLSGYLVDKSPNLQYGTVPVPKDPITGQRGNILFTVGWAINQDSTQKKATEKVIQMLVSKKAQAANLESGMSLPSTSLLNDSPYFQRNTPQSEMAKAIYHSSLNDRVLPYSFGVYGKAWEQPVNIAMTAVMLNQLSIEDALKEAQQKYDDMYTALQAKRKGN